MATNYRFLLMMALAILVFFVVLGLAL
jgi:hypothetical protein